MKQIPLIKSIRTKYKGLTCGNHFFDQREILVYTKPVGAIHELPLRRIDKNQSEIFRMVLIFFPGCRIIQNIIPDLVQ